MMVWVINALLVGLLAGMLLADHMSKGVLQCVVERVTYSEPGKPRVAAWGIQIKTGAPA